MRILEGGRVQLRRVRVHASPDSFADNGAHARAHARAELGAERLADVVTVREPECGAFGIAVAGPQRLAVAVANGGAFVGAFGIPKSNMRSWPKGSRWYV